MIYFPALVEVFVWIFSIQCAAELLTDMPWTLLFSQFLLSLLSSSHLGRAKIDMTDRRLHLQRHRRISPLSGYPMPRSNITVYRLYHWTPGRSHGLGSMLMAPRYVRGKSDLHPNC